MSTVDVFAGSLKPGDSTSLRTLTNVIVSASLFSTAPAFVKERLFLGEQQFRNGFRTGISVGTITDSLNALAPAIGLPQFLSMRAEQVQAIHMRLLSSFPHLLHSVAIAGQPSYEYLSPSGAFFLADIALRQKLQNPEFQTTADEWLRKSVGSTATPLASHSPKLTLARGEAPALSSFFQQVQRELSDDRTPTTVAVKQFLDMAGF